MKDNLPPPISTLRLPSDSVPIAELNSSNFLWQAFDEIDRPLFYPHAAAFFRFASSLASTSATIASRIGLLMPFCRATS